jgi:hypothetical protein
MEMLRPPINQSEDWVVLIFVVCISIIAMVRVIAPLRISKMFSAVFNILVLRQLMREENPRRQENTLLNIGFVLSFSLLSWISIRSFHLPTPLQSNFLLFVVLVFFVAAVYLLKMVFVRLVRWFAGSDCGFTEYLYNTFLINRVVGILLLPFAALAIYGQIHYAQVIIYAALSMLTAAYLYRLGRGLLNAARIGISPFYIFFYICTLEILPLLMGYKVATLY